MKNCPKILALFVLIPVFLNCNIFQNVFDEKNEKDADSTMVQGSIIQNTTWTLEGSPYIVMDTVTVVEGVKLTIEAGVIVQFHCLKPLIIKGTLDAQGSKKSRIMFTRRETFDSLQWNLWSGIIFRGSNESILRYCTIQYCVDHAIAIENCSPIISHCAIIYVDTQAETGPPYLFCEGNSRPVIEYNLIEVQRFNAAGILCLSPANPKILNNNIRCGVDARAVVGGGFLDGNYLEAYDGSVDTTLGNPIDEVGDGVCNTTSTFKNPLFRDVDGVRHPRYTPNSIDQ